MWRKKEEAANNTSVDAVLTLAVFNYYCRRWQSKPSSAELCAHAEVANEQCVRIAHVNGASTTDALNHKTCILHSYAVQ